MSSESDNEILLLENRTDIRNTINTNPAVISPKRIVRNFSSSETNKDSSHEVNFRGFTQKINKMSLEADNNHSFQKLKDENKELRRENSELKSTINYLHSSNVKTNNEIQEIK